MSWRGDNEKITVIREARCSESNYGEIVTFNTEEEMQRYAKEILKTVAYAENQ